VLKEFNRLSHNIDGIQTTVDAFGFDDGVKHIQLLPRKVHLSTSKEGAAPHLDNCFAARVNQTPVIRTGAIDSIVKVNELLLLVQQVASLPFRLCSNQLDSVEFGWDGIELQHLLLISHRQGENNRQHVVHLSTELEDFYAEDHRGKRRLKAESEALEKLPTFLNMAGWIDYCAWYHELLEEAFTHFAYDAVDQYSLERSLMDFRHEVLSPFLAKSRQQLLMLEGQIERKKPENTQTTIGYQRVVDLKKALFRVRQDLLKMARAHHDCLLDIIAAIEIIEQQHPDLILLKLTGQVLHKLLSDQVDPGGQKINWGVKQMLLQLLNDDLGVISAVNCARKLDRTHFAFAIRLAIEQLKRKFSVAEVIEMVMSWDELTRLVNQLFVKNKEEEVLKKQPTDLVVKYREYVLTNLLAFCFPISQANEEKTEIKLQEELKENAVFLNFIPSYRTIPIENNQQEHRELVIYHPNSYEPIGLTKAGQELLLPLFSRKT
ncbi:MAG: hypothetical protein WB791_02850, partial [Waddliaceae bacterium]